MNDNLIATARDNMVRISPTKLSILVNSIVNMKVSSAITVKFFFKRVSNYFESTKWLLQMQKTINN